MHATELPEPFHRDGWIYEEKYDGWRMVAEKFANKPGPRPTSRISANFLGPSMERLKRSGVSTLVEGSGAQARRSPGPNGEADAARGAGGTR